MEIYVVCVVLMIVLVNGAVGNRIVITEFGPVRGTTEMKLGTQVDSFLGIPYAKPPVGDLRFRRPVPREPWTDVYEATMKPPPCFQNASEKYYYMPITDNMTEDCLYLNLWVPRTQSTELKDVLVWIHGGAFVIGSSDMDLYDGAVLAAYGDVIVASMNYRVGFFGFLLSPLSDASGNMGLYDQALAMEWIKYNIESFGGDPEKITILGESAGSMAISGHLLSPMTKSLFKRAIMHSGGGVHALSFNANQNLMKTSNKMAWAIGCSNSTHNITSEPRFVLNCLKDKPAVEITRAEGLMRKSNPLMVYPRYKDDFMPGDIIPMIQEGLYKNADLLLGINEDEGSFFLTASLPEYFGVYGHNGADRVSKRLAHSLVRAIFTALGQNNTQEISDYYINSIANKTTENLRQGIFKALGDYTISCSTLFFADYYSRQRNNVYFFKFSHRPSVTPNANWMGATHFEEIQYIFAKPLRKEVNYTVDEKVFTKRLVDRWLNFAKTGNPNIPGELFWPPYTYHYPVYMDIDMDEKLQLKPDKRCEFWRDRFQANLEESNFAEPLVSHPNFANDLRPSVRALFLMFCLLFAIS